MILPLTPAGDHRLAGFLDADHDAEGIHIHDLVPDCFGSLEERLRLVEARIVDHHPDRAELLCAGVDGAADGGSVRYIDAMEDRLAAIGCGNLLCNRSTLHLIEVSNHDREPVRQKAGGDRPTDAAGRAGNDRSTYVIG